MASSENSADRERPLRLLSFESRRSDEMASLVRRFGAEPTVVPSMRELPLTENSEAFHFAEELLAGRVDVVVFLTGVGAECLLEALRHRYEVEEILRAIDGIRVVVRGPKPTVVLRKWGVHIDVKAPEPNTWRETANAIQSAFDISGLTVAVQEYGKANDAFYDALKSHGASILRVPVYRWALPENVEPLKEAVRGAVDGRHDLFAFTSAQQVENVLTIAEQLGLAEQFTEALRSRVVVSIGPTCSEMLRSRQLDPDLEASPPKMGPMVRLALEQGRDILARKFSKKSN